MATYSLLHTINLGPGMNSLQTADNMLDGANGLPSITRRILIQASADDLPTVIERGIGALHFRIFHVAPSGQLSLDGVIVKPGGSGGSAIFNLGVTSLSG